MKMRGQRNASGKRCKNKVKNQVSRRDFLKGALVVGAVAICDLEGVGSALAAQSDRAKVFFTRDISPDGLLYETSAHGQCRL
jgi:secreted PhoX family phosphatase